MGKLPVRCVCNVVGWCWHVGGRLVPMVLVVVVLMRVVVCSGDGWLGVQF